MYQYDIVKVRNKVYILRIRYIKQEKIDTITFNINENKELKKGVYLFTKLQFYVKNKLQN